MIRKNKTVAEHFHEIWKTERNRYSRPMAILLRFSYRDRLIAASLFVNWVNSVSCLLKLEGGLVKGFDLHFRSDRWKRNELSKIGGGSLLNSRRIVTRSRGIRPLSGSTEARLSQRGGRLTGFSSNKDEQRSVHHQHQLHQLYLENVSFSSIQGRNIYIYIKRKGRKNPILTPSFWLCQAASCRGEKKEGNVYVLNVSIPPRLDAQFLQNFFLHPSSRLET